MQQHVILPIGISGSGKSTWSQSMLGYSIISLDNLRIELTGNINDKSQDEEVYRQAVEHMLLCLALGKNVIIDSTNLKKDRRQKFILAALWSNTPVYYKLFPISPEEAKKRIKEAIAAGVNRADVPPSTIDRHFASYDQAVRDIQQENIIQYK